MSPGLAARRGSTPRFPRVSGDEPDTLYLGPAGTEFSPRERG